ncbi:MAG: hypothetical protein CHACPFDD_02324 [Phycisphaerae bacterium]|nr:hypothetical protein [Phycisphaerae bacterium]
MDALYLLVGVFFLLLTAFVVERAFPRVKS